MRRSHPGEVGTLTGSPLVDGSCDPAFAGLREAFTANFIDHDEIGAALCVYSHGRPVVDLWGGHVRENGPAWQPDTLVNAFSVGKGITALLTAVCVAHGHLAYDDPVARHWPEFAAAGKDSITIREVLGHRAGLPAIRRVLHDDAMYEWETMTSALADETPWWEPGTAHGYHVNTFGFLVGEILRRATGERAALLLRSLVAGPAGADLWFGVPRTEHQRIADLRWNATPTVPADPRNLTEDQLMWAHAHVNPPGLSGVGHVNTERWRSAEMPSTSMHASARGVARAYDAFVHGLVSPEVINDSVREVSDGTDLVLQRNTRFGAGFQLPIPERGFGPNPGAFGHYGAGGSMGFTDPAAEISVGYVMNHMGQGWQTPRNRALVAALYDCLG